MYLNIQAALNSDATSPSYTHYSVMYILEGSHSRTIRPKTDKKNIPI